MTASRGNGTLTGVTTVQRITPQGGRLEGACEQAGVFQSAAYATDHVFLRK